SVSFADLPIPREISDPTANVLSGDYLTGTITISPLPSLNIIRAGSNVALSWPSWASNFVLQENLNVNSTGVWTNVNATVSTTNNTSSVTLPRTGSTRYYRLLKQ